MRNPQQNSAEQKNIELMTDDQDMNYWSNEFGIAKEELLSMVKHGSTIAEALAAYVMKMKFV